MKRLVLLTVFILSMFTASSTTYAVDRLNVLFITLDDMNRDSVGVYGAKVPNATPHIDRLASQGFRFEHAHVTIAICQPTRAVWMTGRYPHNSGALGFDEIDPGVPTLPETLRRHGFLTGVLGKTEHVVPSRKEAFEYSRNRTELGNGRSQERYGEFVAEFLTEAKQSDRPFFLMVNAHDPHRPFDSRKPASERKISEAIPVKIKKGKGKGKVTYQGDHPAPSLIYQPDEIVVPGFLPDLPDIREEIAQYYSSVRRADDVVGRVLAELKAAGFDKSTVVMLKSDHGIAVPFAKSNVWRHSTWTPWIIRWPGVLQPGTHDTEHVVSGVDFAPTILDILNIEPMEGMEGRSLRPIFKGEQQGDRDIVHTYLNTLVSKRSYTMRSVQGTRYGFIWNGWSDGETSFSNAAMKRGLTWNAMERAAKADPMIAARVNHLRYRVPFEFYDYQQDPDARKNLIDDPELQETIRAYRQRMEQHMRSTKDPELWRLERSILAFDGAHNKSKTSGDNQRK